MESREGKKKAPDEYQSIVELLFTHSYYELETTRCRQCFRNNYTRYIIFALLVLLPCYLVTVSALSSIVTTFFYMLYL